MKSRNKKARGKDTPKKTTQQPNLTSPPSSPTISSVSPDIAEDLPPLPPSVPSTPTPASSTLSPVVDERESSSCEKSAEPSPLNPEETEPQPAEDSNEPSDSTKAEDTTDEQSIPAEVPEIPAVPSSPEASQSSIAQRSATPTIEGAQTTSEDLVTAEELPITPLKEVEPHETEQPKPRAPSPPPSTTIRALQRKHSEVKTPRESGDSAKERRSASHAHPSILPRPPFSLGLASQAQLQQPFASRVPLEHYSTPPATSYQPRYFSHTPPSAPPYYHAMSPPNGYANGVPYPMHSQHSPSPYHPHYGSFSSPFDPYSNSPPVVRHDSVASRGSNSLDYPPPASAPDDNSAIEDDTGELFSRIASAIPDLHLLLARYKDTHGQLGFQGELLQQAEMQNAETIKRKDDHIDHLTKELEAEKQERDSEKTKHRLEIGNQDENLREFRDRIAVLERSKVEDEKAKAALEVDIAASEAAKVEMEKSLRQEFEDWKTTAHDPCRTDQIALAVQFDKNLKEQEVAAEAKRSEDSENFAKQKNELLADFQNQKQELECGFQEVRNEFECKLTTIQKDLEDALQKEQESRESSGIEREQLVKSHEEDIESRQKQWNEQSETLAAQHKKAQDDSDKAWIELHADATKRTEEERVKVEQLAKEKDELQTSLEAEKVQLGKEKDELQQCLVKEKEQAAEQKKQADELAQEKEQLKKSLAEEKEQFENEKVAAAQLAKEKNELQESLVKEKEQIAEQKKQADELAQKNDLLEKSLADEKEQLEKEQAATMQLTKEKDELRESLVKEEEQATEQKKQADELSEKVDQLEKNLAEEKEQLEKERAMAVQLGKEKDEIQKSLESEKEQTTKAQAVAEELAKGIDQLQKSLDDEKQQAVREMEGFQQRMDEEKDKGVREKDTLELLLGAERAQFANDKTEREKAIEELERRVREASEVQQQLAEEKSAREQDLDVIKSVAANLEAEKSKLEKLAECYGGISDIKSKGDAFYLDSFRQLSAQILDLAKTHFAHLPVVPPADVLSTIPSGLPSFLGDTEASRQIRTAYVAHTISKIITFRIFTPFLFSLGRRYDKADGLLNTMSSYLRGKSTRKEAVWRQHTLVAAFTSSGAKQRINSAAGSVVEEVVDAIKHFTTPTTEEAIRTAVRRIIKLAAETWRLARLEREMIVARLPAVDDQAEALEGAWPAYTFESAILPTIANSVVQSYQDPPKMLMRLFPIIQREPIHESFRLTDQEKEDKGYIYSYGLALYEDANPVVVREEELLQAGLPPSPLSKSSPSSSDFPPPTLPPPRNAPPPVPKAVEDPLEPRPTEEELVSIASEEQRALSAIETQSAPSMKSVHSSPTSASAASTSRPPTLIRRPPPRTQADEVQSLHQPATEPVNEAVVVSPKASSTSTDLPKGVVAPPSAQEEPGYPTPPRSRAGTPPSPLFAATDEIDGLRRHESRPPSLRRSSRPVSSHGVSQDIPRESSGSRRGSGYTISNRSSMEGPSGKNWRIESRSAAIKGLYPDSPLAGSPPSEKATTLSLKSASSKSERAEFVRRVSTGKGEEPTWKSHDVAVE